MKSETKFNHAKRLKRLQAQLGSKALFLFARNEFNANIFYFTGEATTPAALIATRNNATLYSLDPQPSGFLDSKPLKNFNQDFKQFLKKNKRVAIDEKRLTTGLTLKMQKKRVRVHPFSKQLAAMRAVKDAQEKKCVKKAQQITKQSVSSLLEKGLAGKTGNQVAGLLEARAREFGGELTAFPPIVLVNQETRHPHGIPSNKKIGRGDLVLLDVGARFNWYCGDYSTTIYEGRDREIQEAITAVKQAREAAVRKAKPKARGREIARAALAVLKEHGFEKTSFARKGLSIGHFIGLNTHDGFKKLEATTLWKSNAFTIEPGVYSQRYGVRFEDITIL